MSKDFYSDLFFFQFFATFAEILRSPCRFFTTPPDIKLVSAGKFLLMSYGLFALITLWSGNFTTQATWANADFESFSEQEVQTFSRVLKVKPEDVSNIEFQAFSESFRPCLSPLSRHISEIVGSCRLDKIADYFLKVGEPTIATKLMKSVYDYGENQQKFEFIQVAIVPLLVTVFAYFFSKIADKQHMAQWIQAKTAHYYYWGAMLFVLSVVIALFSVVIDLEDTHQVYPYLLLIVLSPLVLWGYYVLYMLGKCVYGASFGRTLWAFMVSATAVKLLLFGVVLAFM